MFVTLPGPAAGAAGTDVAEPGDAPPAVACWARPDADRARTRAVNAVNAARAGAIDLVSVWREHMRSPARNRGDRFSQFIGVPILYGNSNKYSGLSSSTGTAVLHWVGQITGSPGTGPLNGGRHGFDGGKDSWDACRAPMTRKSVGTQRNCEHAAASRGLAKP